MSEKLKQLEELVASLTLEDLVDHTTNTMPNLWGTHEKIRQVFRTIDNSYHTSGYYQKWLDNYRSKNQAAKARKETLDQVREKWARDNLEVGMYVKVTGAKGNPYRRVMKIYDHHFDNVQINLKDFEEKPMATTTQLNKIIGWYNFVEKRWQDVP